MEPDYDNEPEQDYAAPDYGDDPDQPQYLHPNDCGIGGYKRVKASPVAVNPATGEPGRILPVGTALP